MLIVCPQIDVAVNATEAGVIKEFFVNEEDTVTVGQDLVRVEVGGEKPASSGEAEKPKAKEESTPSASESKPAAAEPEQPKSQPEPAQAQKPAPPQPAEQPQKKSQPEPAASSQPASGSREERRVGLPPLETMQS